MGLITAAFICVHSWFAFTVGDGVTFGTTGGNITLSGAQSVSTLTGAGVLAVMRRKACQ